MKRVIIFWGAIFFNSCILLFNINSGYIYTLINLVVVLNIIVVLIMQISSKRFLTELKTLAGKDNQKTEKKFSVRQYLIDTNMFLEDAERAISDIKEIGQDQFGNMVLNIKNESIRTSLLSAHHKIIELRKKEKENNWITGQVAAIADLKHKSNDISAYSSQVISTLVKSLNANQGGFFLLRKDADNSYFELTASYAYNKKKYIERNINVGDGQIGQVYYEKNIIYLTDVPKDYVKITSGLGEALPTCICIIPLLSEGNVYGAIEIASFQKLEEFQMEYLRKISESIGYNLSAIETNQRTELLLAESQKMSQEVKSQEEELRQNMEELTATQEQMRREQKEMDAVMASLSTVELDMDGNVTSANSVFLSITGFLLKDVQGKLYKNLTGQTANELVQYEMMWSSILSGQSFSGEFRIINKSRKEMWMAGNFTPIMNERGQPYKVMLVSLFTTQDKVKLQELQELVTAMKNSLPMIEINQDMTFKSGNDLFLSELGIRRMELKKVLPINALGSNSYRTVETYINDSLEAPQSLILEINEKSGSTRKFNSTLIKINSEQCKRSLLILRNPIQ